MSGVLPESALGKLIFLVICIGLIVYVTINIAELAKVKCGSSGSVVSLMVENFSANYDSSVKYYKNLNKRLDDLDANIQTSTLNIDKIDKQFTSFQSDICYILNQVDDGIEGNYCANVPEEEFKMSAAEQEKRKKARREKAVKYVANLKTAFIESKKGTPILECFADTEELDPTEKADLDTMRSNLGDRINEVKNNLEGLKSTLNKLKAALSEKQIAMYYVTLQYNNKYLMQMITEMTKKREGFEANPLNSFLEAVSPEPVKTDPSDLIESLESTYKPIDEEIKTTEEIIMKFIKVTAEQKVMLKKTKSIGTDTDYQKQSLDSSYSQVAAAPK